MSIFQNLLLVLIAAALIWIAALQTLSAVGDCENLYRLRAAYETVTGARHAEGAAECRNSAYEQRRAKNVVDEALETIKELQDSLGDGAN